MYGLQQRVGAPLPTDEYANGDFLDAYYAAIFILYMLVQGKTSSWSMADNFTRRQG